MLILTRKLGESITIGDDIRVTVLGIFGRQVRIGIDAPLDTDILRDNVRVRLSDAKANSKSKRKE